MFSYIVDVKYEFSLCSLVICGRFQFLLTMENVRQRRFISKESFPTLEEKCVPIVVKDGTKNRWLKTILFLPLFILFPLQFAYLYSPISAVVIEGVEVVTLDGAFAVNEKLSFGKRYVMV